MKKIEQTLDSREVAEMVEKEHKNIIRDIGRYIKQIDEGNEKCEGQLKIEPSDFFTKSTYKNSQNKELPCYRITKKGCEFIAHKLTGTKGAIFTARYINRFHEMQDELSGQEAEPELPWFIHRFRGDHIMLFRDFKSLTGVEMFGNYTTLKRTDKLEGGLDYNGWGWYTVINKEAFLKEYRFEYGDEDCMYYLCPCGIKRALEIYRQESGKKLDQEAYDIIADGLKAIELPEKKEIATVKQNEVQSITNVPPIQISILVGGEQRVIANTGGGAA